VLNEDELMSLLAPLGFKSYCLEDLSFSEQVKLFACAKTIVGTHGSGLTNMVWADPGARIIELMPENRLHSDYFQLSRALGHSYAALICKAPAGGSDITVNLAEFRKCLKGFI
jgi:capsular polysaccharide biosynthesis protein